MRVDIRVLSGSRRSECLELDADEFRVGGEPSCDVYFDPEKDPSARGVCLQIRRDDAGWRIWSSGGAGSLVNQRVLVSDLPLRSGDVVRLSPAGPDFRFSVSALTESGYFRASAPVSAGRSAGDVPVVQPAAPATAWAAGVGETARQKRRPPLASIAAIVAAALLLILALVVFLRREGAPHEQSHTVAAVEKPRPAETESPAPAVEEPKSPEPKSPASTPEKPKPAESEPPAPAVEKPKPPEPEPPAPAPVTAVLSPLAVLAIENKRSQQLEPYAAACAVELDGRQMLLTTARIARIMALFPQQYYAILPGRTDKEPIVVEVNRDSMFMHLLYMNMVEQGNLQVAQFFDVGVLMLADKLPAGAARRVASKADVDGIKSGSTLQCWSADKPPDIPFFQGAILNREYRLTVREQSVKLNREIPLTEGSGGEDAKDIRRLLELSGPRENFLEGSPVLDSQGQVVALYSTSMVPTDSQTRPKTPTNAQPGLPKAALVDAEMLTALWTGYPSRLWFAYVPEDAPKNPTGARNGNPNTSKPAP
jgi:hypothetical protein